MKHVDHLPEAIAHLRSELNEAKRTSRTDISGAAFRTLNAANGLVRVFAYLAPELGLDQTGEPNRPDPLPKGWDRYVEVSWDDWSHTFHRLPRVDEHTTTAQLVAILAELCLLMNSWLKTIGIDAGITDDDEEFISRNMDRY